MAGRPRSTPSPPSFPRRSICCVVFMRCALPFAGCVSRYLTGRSVNAGSPRSRRCFTPPPNVPCDGGWISGKPRRKAPRPKGSSPDWSPKCPNCCRPSALPFGRLPAMPPNAFWVPSTDSIRPKDPFKARRRLKNIWRCFCWAMSSKPTRPKPPKSDRDTVRCSWLAIRWKPSPCSLAQSTQPGTVASAPGQRIRQRRLTDHYRPDNRIAKVILPAGTGRRLSVTA